jgi:hypothetical protein
MRGTEPNVYVSGDGGRWGEPERNGLNFVVVDKHVKQQKTSHFPYRVQKVVK